MVRSLFTFFSELGLWAIPISLMINTFINIIGFIPSVFVTAANVWVWGPWLGGLLSWLGEVIGSMAAFLFYRKGLQLTKMQKHRNWDWVQSLNRLSGTRQTLLLVLARVTPFIPSGLVNIAAVLTSVPFFIFLISTAIGKIPSILLEALVSHDLIHIQENYIRLTVTLFAVSLGYLALRRKKAGDDRS
ncbi:TVP38/TMEM64 family protein [Paenactinomyces guangxiensis]|uniref:TVP38/TMEM64 family membrane protein n=1 Tax=Paenactinomyces guangxiensis TaxID=1490290 RepID=A0A7W2AAL6_9BACL|nr:VTT domain-containing protein [Paenactinomyces guangxiensis]MBA4496023.1 TVP38/TMEM64 family protein [Paenactinomyces guangxiensis]MBH8593101.1 TVP38/TMEM64 family protein [Paenactinomyces guangxiensis]